MNSSESRAEAAAATSQLAFGEFRLDLVRRRLLDGRGTPVEMSPRLLDALVYFVEHRGELLDKDRLLGALWPGQVVEENNLNKAVSALRRALGDDGNERRYLLTVPRRGFRFVADVREVAGQDTAVEAPTAAAETESVASGTAAEAAAPASDAARTADARRRRVVFGGILATTATIAAGLGVGFLVRQRDGDHAAPHPALATTLAVLPFRPLAEAGGTRDEILELGMADSLIARLSAARGVIVRPVGAVRRYAGHDTDPLQAARELHVDWVLEGTIQQRGDRMRVTARLLDVRDGSAAWSDSFDQAFTHVFDVQEAISRRVADVLMPRLGERERESLGVAGTRSIETYRVYLEARYLSQLFTPDAFRRSIALYEQAIAGDPRYAYAYHGLADVLRRTQYTSNTPPRQTWGRIRTLAERAVDIDPQYGDGVAMLGWVAYWFDWNWPRAERTFARALELNPSSIDAHHGLAQIHLSNGRVGEALYWFMRAREIDPHSPLTNALEGGTLASSGRIDEGIARIRRALQIGEGFWIGHMVLGSVLFSIGETDAALESLRRAVELSSGSAWASGPLGYALGQSGRVEEARAVLRDMQAKSRDVFISPSMIGLVQVGLGENDAALEALERAYEERDIRLVFLQIDHRWNAIRADPRFVALAKKLNLDPRPPKGNWTF